MDTPKVSVLIPVYNAVNYIEYAIRSVLNQSLQDFEIIIVNDGSNDGSDEILEKLKNQDERIRVFHQENKGVAYARNVLVSHARGEYITFLDADDALESNYLELLYGRATATDSDIALCSYYTYSEKNKKYQYYKLEKGYSEKIFSGLEAYQHYYSHSNRYEFILSMSACKIIRRSLLSEVHFPVGRFFEDSATIYMLYFKANRILYLNQALYMYRQHDGSIMHSHWSREKVRDFILQHEERLSLLSVMGIEITEDNKADYKASLRNCIDISLEHGYMEEYLWLKQKLNLIECHKHY